MNEQTKHKWLPSEPTQEMLDAERFASSLAYESHEVQAVKVYKAMWQAAPEIEQEPVITKRDNGLTLGVAYDSLPTGTRFYTHPQPCEPLSEDVIGELIDKLPYGSDYFMEFARMVEKAHGIGVE
jgi:hypothetical protein